MPESQIVNIAIFDNIPQELRQAQRWVNFKLVRQGERWTKPPYQPNGVAASKTNPDHWASFDEVVAAYASGKHRFHGIGRVFTKDEPFVCQDFDNCIDATTGLPFLWVVQLLEAFPGYTEKSPSGLGLHNVGIGTLEGTSRNQKPIEVYGPGSYVTFTGDVFGDRKALHRWNGNLSDLETCITPLAKAVRTPTAEGGLNFAKLFSGDILAYDDDDSKADFAFVLDMVKTGSTDEQIVAAWRLSGLWRDKSEHDDYRSRTISKARQKAQEEGYGPQVEERKKEERFELDAKPSSHDAGVDQLLTPEFEARLVDALMSDNPKRAIAHLKAGLPQSRKVESVFADILACAQEIAEQRKFEEAFCNPDYLFDAADALGWELPAESLFIIDRFIERGQINNCVAAPGSLKTAMAIYMGLCSVTGTPFCDMEVTTPCGVMLIGTESSKPSMIRRLHATAKHYGITQADLRQAGSEGRRFLIRTMEELNENLKLPGGQKVLARELKKANIGLVFLDTQSNVMRGDENSNQDMAEFCSALRHICAKAGAAVVPLHHPSRLSEDKNIYTFDGRGAVSARGAARSQFTLLYRKEQNQGVLTHTKLNEAKRQEQREYSAAFETLTLANGEEVEAIVFHYVGFFKGRPAEQAGSYERLGSKEWRHALLVQHLSSSGGLTKAGGLEIVTKQLNYLKGIGLQGADPVDEKTIGRDFVELGAEVVEKRGKAQVWAIRPTGGEGIFDASSGH